MEVFPEQRRTFDLALLFHDIKIDTDVVHGQLLAKAKIDGRCHIGYELEREERCPRPLRLIRVVLVLKVVESEYLFRMFRRRRPRIADAKCCERWRLGDGKLESVGSGSGIRRHFGSKPVSAAY